MVMQLNGRTITTELPIGDYSWEVVDDHGCKISGAIEVREPDSKFKICYNLIALIINITAASLPLSITSISTASTEGSTLTLTGSSFLAPLEVYINDELTVVDSYNFTHLVCRVPEGTGSGHSISVFSGGEICQVSFNSSWSYPHDFIIIL